MNGKHLLDTNIIVALFKDDDNVRNQIAASPEVFVPAIAIGELYFGAQHSARVEKNMKQVREFSTSGRSTGYSWKNGNPTRVPMRNNHSLHPTGMGGRDFV